MKNLKIHYLISECRGSSLPWICSLNLRTLGDCKKLNGLHKAAPDLTPISPIILLPCSYHPCTHCLISESTLFPHHPINKPMPTYFSPKSIPFWFKFIIAFFFLMFWPMMPVGLYEWTWCYGPYQCGKVFYGGCQL